MKIQALGGTCTSPLRIVDAAIVTPFFEILRVKSNGVLCPFCLPFFSSFVVGDFFLCSPFLTKPFSSVSSAGPDDVHRNTV